ncbi:hypothetical protein [Azospirillum halopraeferens]|uniref:hypothetical protein n=1 Tax=Azospirillum halopraeferens TaxID=34010 RepID=UPI000423668F|nr:hypothetical protein [Azospirillum halopraeferens]
MPALLRRRLLTQPASVAVGILDFSYAPYALGDTITWQVNQLVLARENWIGAVDHLVMVDRYKPANKYQPHITSANYITHLNSLMPALYINPLLRTVRVFHDRDNFQFALMAGWRLGRPAWPSYDDHFRGALDFSTHRRIDEHYRAHGSIPRLGPPRGFGAWAGRTLADRFAGRFVVAVHIRNTLYTAHPNQFHRNAPLAEWRAFLDRAQRERPDALFMLMGGYDEWDFALANRPNVWVPRREGLGLAHELALMMASDLFMGSSSGFSAMATFSTLPYVITHIEAGAANYIFLDVGTPRYHFGLPNQVLHWPAPDRNDLWSLFSDAHGVLKDTTGDRARQFAGHGDAAPVVQEPGCSGFPTAPQQDAV